MGILNKTTKPTEPIETIDVLLRITLTDVVDKNIDNFILDTTTNIKNVLETKLKEGKIIPKYSNVRPEYLLLNAIEIDFNLSEKL